MKLGSSSIWVIWSEHYENLMLGKIEAMEKEKLKIDID